MIEIKARGNRKQYSKFPRTKINNRGGDKAAVKKVMADWYNGYRYDYTKVRRFLHSNIGRPYNNILSELKSTLGKSVVRITPMEILRNNVYESKEEVPESWGGFYWSNSILNYKNPRKIERVNNNGSSLWRKCFNYNTENMLSNKELYSKANEAKSKGLALLGKFYVNHMGNTYFTNVYLVPVNSIYHYDRVKLIGEYNNIGIAVSCYSYPNIYKYTYDVMWYNSWFSTLPPYVFVAKKLSNKQAI